MDYLEKYAQERLEKLKGMRRQCVANLKGLPEGKVYVKKKRKTNQFYKITPDMGSILKPAKEMWQKVL